MKKFDKKFADHYINEMLENEREFERDIFVKQMSPYERTLYDMKVKTKYEHPPLVQFFLKCNWFEKIMLIIAQLSACCLPFVMVVALGSMKMASVTYILWISGAASLVLLSISKRIRGEKIKISLLPTLEIKNERRYY